MPGTMNDAIIQAAISQKQNRLMQLIEMSDIYLNLKHNEYLIITHDGEHTVVGEAESGCVGFYRGQVIIADDNTENPDKLLFDIRAELDGKEWSPDTLERIADILRNGGHAINPPGDTPDERSSTPS